MRTKTSLLLLSIAICSCARLETQVPPDTDDSYSLLSLPKRLIRTAAPQTNLSEWHFESLALCQIRDTELEDFTLPVSVNIWDRVRDGFSITPQINRRIQQEIEWYAKHPSYLARVSERAEKYLFHVVEEIDKRSMPMELALLPIVESAFDPFAYSPGRAAGMWQVIPGTGTMLGLKQNWWYDGRRDVMASTDAALTYLEQLYRQVGNDWLLALAAYNSGAGNVQKAVKRNKAKGLPTDYWSLSLPRETEMYVPRLLALKALVENPDIYGLSFYPVANEPYFVSVDVGAQIDLAQAASWADMSMEELAALNPGFNRWATDPDGPHRLLFPRHKAGKFIEKLAETPVEQRVVWDRYEIKSGDTLSTIAKRYHTTTDLLQSINKLPNHNLRAGRTLMVPKSAASAEFYSHTAGQRLQRVQANGKGTKVEYQVRSGDSLWQISRKFNVSTGQLAKWNGMAPGDPIFPGQKLVIWKQTSTGTAATSDNERAVIRKLAYKVRKGDSLSAIADKFKVRVADIREWNNVDPSRHLKPGQNLTLFVDVTRVQ
jgi:membrane-bound lytic murein transglycosylase D